MIANQKYSYDMTFKSFSPEDVDFIFINIFLTYTCSIKKNENKVFVSRKYTKI